MKALMIKTNDEIVPIEIEERDDRGLADMQKAVGGYIEVVYPSEIRPLIMICNEDGLYMGLEDNAVASAIFGGRLVGNVLIMKTCYIDGEPEIVGFKDNEEMQEVLADILIKLLLGKG